MHKEKYQRKGGDKVNMSGFERRILLKQVFN